MTRSEPLTSLALGRSPYDGVVQGEGVSDSNASYQQQYDERGRPINPESKRLNRELIRAHNEVMLAIGVAEQDDGTAERLEMQKREAFKQEADTIGNRLWHVGRVVEIAGAWGVHGLRKRILIYRQYSQIPFADLYAYERSRRTFASLALAGLPSHVADIALRLSPLYSSPPFGGVWFKLGIQYVRLHLQLFIFLQRIELLSPSSWLPGPLFFIPFTTVSPIPAPPPLQSFSPGGILQWLGGFVASVSPVMAFWCYWRLSHLVRTWMWLRTYETLPSPTNFRSTSTGRPSISASDAVSGAQTRQGDSQAGANGGQAETGEDGSSAPALRRQSTLESTRGDDYGSDDEEGEGEGVSATLISFDVEAVDAPESTDTPAGVWSAELRPNNASDAPTTSSGAPPLYADNALTRLPAMLAANMLSAVASNVFLAPLEAHVMRNMARSLLRNLGLSTAAVYGLNFFGGLSWTAAGNFLCVEMVQLLIQGDIWAAMVMIADILTEDPPEA